MTKCGGLLLAGAAALISGAAAAQPTAAAGLGRSVAAAAAVAERGGGSPDGVRQAVTVAVQGVIIASATEPKGVLDALDEALAVCQSADRGAAAQWSCPGSSASFAALNALRAIVLAQADQTAPAALGTRGFAAFGSVPTTSAGGAGYNRP